MKKHVTRCLTVLMISVAFVATAESISAQCRTVDLANLKLEQETAAGGILWHIKDPTNEWWYVFFDVELPKHFYSILQTYKVKSICRVPGYGVHYVDESGEVIADTLSYNVLLLTEDGKPIKGTLKPNFDKGIKAGGWYETPTEECVAFKPGNLQITYSDTEQAQVLTDGNVIVDSDPITTLPLKAALSMIQQYSLDTRCTVSTTVWARIIKTGPFENYGEYRFGYYKSQHPPQSTSSANAPNAAKLFGKESPRAVLDDKTLRVDANAISGQELRLRFLFGKINARAIKWPPNPRDPIIREILARERTIQSRSVGAYLRRRGAREPQGLKTFAALGPLANQLHRAVQAFMNAGDANSGSEKLRQITPILDAIKAKAAEIK